MEHQTIDTMYTTGSVVGTNTSESLYVLNQRLGDGACGVVFSAVRRADSEPVAVKIMHLSRLEEMVQVSKERTSAQWASQILQEHGLVPHVYESVAWRKEKKLFYAVVMELIPGLDLYGFGSDLLKHNEMVPEPLAALIVRDITQALHFLHTAQPAMIHRDLKTMNVMVSVEGRVCLCDFGTARQLRPSDDARTFCGTEDMMAPEMLRGDAHGTALDIWTLGLLVYEVLTMENPYPLSEWTADSKIDAWRRGETPILPDTFSESAQVFVQVCLQVAPEKRATSAALLNEPFVAEPRDWTCLREELGALVTRADQQVRTASQLDQGLCADRESQSGMGSFLESTGHLDLRSASASVHRRPPSQATASMRETTVLSAEDTLVYTRSVDVDEQPSGAGVADGVGYPRSVDWAQQSAGVGFADGAGYPRSVDWAQQSSGAGAADGAGCPRSVDWGQQSAGAGAADGAVYPRSVDCGHWTPVPTVSDPSLEKAPGLQELDQAIARGAAAGASPEVAAEASPEAAAGASPEAAAGASPETAAGASPEAAAGASPETAAGASPEAAAGASPETAAGASPEAAAGASPETAAGGAGATFREMARRPQTLPAASGANRQSRRMARASTRVQLPRSMVLDAEADTLAEALDIWPTEAPAAQRLLAEATVGPGHPAEAAAGRGPAADWGAAAALPALLTADQGHLKAAPPGEGHGDDAGQSESNRSAGPCDEDAYTAENGVAAGDHNGLEVSRRVRPVSVPASRVNPGSDAAEKGASWQPGDTRLTADQTADPTQEITTFFTLAELQRGAPVPQGVDSRREWLSDSDFESVFQMTKVEFKQLKPWRQQQKRRDFGLF